MKKLVRWILFLEMFLWVALSAFAQDQAGKSQAQPGAEKKYYLFAYFKDFSVRSGDGLHFAYSDDGLIWKEIGQDKLFFKPKVGRMFRDPFIMQGPDGVFRMTWTATESGIGYARSQDLVNWTDEKIIPVMAHEPTVRNCWAPEIFYDDANKNYLIFWSSTIPGRFLETDNSGDHGFNHRIYSTTTSDFETFSPAHLLYDPGFELIDADIIKAGDDYYMFFKNETRHPVKKYIAYATSKNAAGPYGKPSAPITGKWVEGPAAIRIGDKGEKWFVYCDRFIRNKYGVTVSTDLKSWQKMDKKLKMPADARHGSVLKISGRTLSKLQAE